MHLHNQIESHIREMIKTGAYQVGSQIETETNLAKQFQVSRPTVRQAIQSLVNQGHLVRTKGKGTFVTEPKILHESTTLLSSYHLETRKKHQTLITHVLSKSVEPVNEKIAEILQIKPSEKISKVERLRFVKGFNDDKPVLFTTLFVPYKVFPELITYDYTVESFYDILDQNNLTVFSADKVIEVVSPDKKIADIMETGKFEPQILVTNIGRSSSNQIIEYSESYYPASCSKFLITVNRPS